MRNLLHWALVLVVLAGGYYWMVLDSRMPADANYPLDIAELRRLADSVPGPKPTGIRYEHVYTTRFAKGMAVTGDGWSGTDVPIYSYQLVYPDRTMIVDTAMERRLAGPKFLAPFYDDAAWQRMLAAMEQASLIVVTHEHMDHIGGVAAHPNLQAILPQLKLTDMQLAHPSRSWPVKLPKEAFVDYKPLQYDRHHVAGPGVVLIEAAGHTPGSQMVFVTQADGREILLLGDVVWKMRNIETQRERPRWVTALMIREDRHAVFGQIKALGELMQQEPDVKIVPGHDATVVDALAETGYLQKGFKP